MAAVLDLRRLWPLDPADLSVHRNGEGWFDRLAVAERAQVEALADRSVLADRLAVGLRTVLDPIFGAIRQRARFGVRAMWGACGTCCLYYKVSGQPLDPRGEAYCTSCPFRDDLDRRARWAARLDEPVAAS